MKPVIITGCSEKYMAPFSLSFMPTLRAFEPDIPVAFMDYDNQCPDGVQHYIEAPDGSTFLQRSHRGGGIVARWLESTDYSHVLIVCAGDVWFQGKLSDLWGYIDSERVLLCPETTKCSGPWFIKQLQQLPRLSADLIRIVLGDRPLLNCGVIAAETEAMANFLIERQYLIDGAMEQAEPCPFGLDQVVSNFMAATSPEKFWNLPRKYNYMPAFFPWQEVDGFLHTLTSDGSGSVVPVICHNAGGRPFPRKVDGQLIDIQNRDNV